VTVAVWDHSENAPSADSPFLTDSRTGLSAERYPTVKEQSPTAQTTAVTIASVGDLTTLIPSFEWLLRATNKSPKTVSRYLEAARQLLGFLWESGMPTAVANIGREDVESLVASKRPR
jgi:hypothetical protein